MTRVNSFRAWRARRQLRREAHLLMKEARRIRRRYAYRLTAAQSEALAERLEHLVAGLRGQEPLDPAVDALGALLDGDLAFAKKSSARQYVESIGAVVFVALCLRSFVVEAYQIPSGSMIPTLQVGDHIFVNKMIYGVRLPFTEIKFATGFRPPRRGEIIVFTHPVERDKDLIKRVVAVGGDEVEMRGNVVFVNGVPTARRDQGARHYFDFDEGSERWVERDAEAFGERIGPASYTTLQDPSQAPRRFGPVQVPAGQLFVMGDNRDNSSDSRYWGFVPLNLVRGRAMVVWWSHGEPEGVRFGRFGHLIE
ncbi:MAG: signal peptidase I [Polyangia bacterium]